MLDALSKNACKTTLHADTARDGDRARLAEALLRVGKEDREAFRLVYTLTSSKLFGICVLICGERSAAEDVLADVYLTVWKRAGAWDPARGSAITWLAAIARNRAIDWRRAQAVRGVVVNNDFYDVPDDVPDGEARLLSAQNAAHIRRCLHMLKPEQESAIRAAFFGGRTYKELALHRGVPIGTMKGWVRRGLAQLRIELEREEETAEPSATTAVISPRLSQPYGFGPTRCA